MLPPQDLKPVIDGMDGIKISQGLGLQDFDLIRVIGRGSYAKVLLVRLKKNDQVYAMKVVKKELVHDDEVSRPLGRVPVSRRPHSQGRGRPALPRGVPGSRCAPCPCGPGGGGSGRLPCRGQACAGAATAGFPGQPRQGVLGPAARPVTCPPGRAASCVGVSAARCACVPVTPGDAVRLASCCLASGSWMRPRPLAAGDTQMPAGSGAPPVRPLAHVGDQPPQKGPDPPGLGSWPGGHSGGRTGAVTCVQRTRCPAGPQP